MYSLSGAGLVWGIVFMALLAVSGLLGHITKGQKERIAQIFIVVGYITAAVVYAWFFMAFTTRLGAFNIKEPLSLVGLVPFIFTFVLAPIGLIKVKLKLFRLT